MLLYAFNKSLAKYIFIREYNPPWWDLGKKIEDNYFKF